ncbi:MAG: efflux RND transporter permease subunit, partial [Candidatus Berkiella sp.]
MQFTDLFIRRPVLATVVSLMILVLGLRAMGLLPIRQFPFTQNAVITVTTVYTGADPALIAGFITTPLENSIAQADGIDYLTSTSTLGTSTISANLRLNYDPDKAMTEINTKVNAVLNLLPKEAQVPTLSVSIGQTIDAMYIGFNSDVLASNKITDYLVRVVQPKLQAIDGVQNAEILGQRTFAMRAWLNPDKMSAFNVTGADIATALANNDFISAAGRTDGQMVTVNLIADTGLHTVEEFKQLIIKSQNGAIVRLEDVGTVSLGSENYDTAVGFDGQQAVYIGIQVAPAANLLTVIDSVRKAFPDIQNQLPEGLNGQIVYDSTKFVNSSIKEVVRSLLEAILIVTVVIFIFLGSMRSVLIPVIAIPLSLVGTFFIMLVLGYSINLLSLLALVLAIGLVVDDAIIVVENVFRHMEEGVSRLQAAIIGARELANPIIAISVVLIAVYVPIGFMGGLTGALFTEFAFTLAGAVGISAVVALTLSPMMCSKFLKLSNHDGGGFMEYINKKFAKLEERYENTLHHSLNFLPVTAVFAAIILLSNYYLYESSKKELAPQEDQGIIISQLTTAPNASLGQTQLFSRQIYETFAKYPETDHVFQLDGISGLNSGIAGMVLTPWDDRKRTAEQLQPLVQKELNHIAGAKIAVFQPAPLPGSSGLPVQFVIQTTESYNRLNEVTQSMMDKITASGMFIYVDTDLKIDKAQTSIELNRDKVSELGLTMQDVGNVLASNLSQNYVNFFSMAGRSYKVIPQVVRNDRLNDDQLLDYYITAANGTSVPLSTIATLKTTVVPESVNHFQQLNSATIMGVPFPGITMGQILDYLTNLSKEMLPGGYTMDTAGQSRQYMQESSALVVTVFFALIIIFLTLAALFESFRDPLIVLISVPMSICGA